MSNGPPPKIDGRTQLVDEVFAAHRRAFARAEREPDTVHVPGLADEFMALVEQGERAIADERPWYLQGRDLYRFRYGPIELERLTRIAGRLGIPQWLAEDGAFAIQVTRGCDRLESFDRMARALERVELPELSPTFYDQAWRLPR